MSTTYKGASKFHIQVKGFKFIFMLLMGSQNFVEFVRFVPKGLNPI
jgi:hypothetical protein